VIVFFILCVYFVSVVCFVSTVPALQICTSACCHLRLRMLYNAIKHNNNKERRLLPARAEARFPWPVWLDFGGGTEDGWYHLEAQNIPFSLVYDFPGLTFFEEESPVGRRCSRGDSKSSPFRDCCVQGPIVGFESTVALLEFAAW
jgi:hypothetical protein